MKIQVNKGFLFLILFLITSCHKPYCNEIIEGYLVTHVYHGASKTCNKLFPKDKRKAICCSMSVLLDVMDEKDPPKNKDE